jgi:predicted nicotinamide N-methyase
MNPPEQLHPMSDLVRRFDCVERQVVLQGRLLTMLAVRDTNALLEQIDPEEFALDERLPYWSELWRSAPPLARLLSDSAVVEGKRVLELGCGLGLVGIAAALAGADVVMTDYDDDALQFSRVNIQRNIPDAERRPRVRTLDWRTPGPIGRFDIVAGSDILYERRFFEPLCALLNGTLARGGRALLTDPGRSVAEDFARLAAGRGFRVAHTRLPRSVGDTADVVLYELRSGIVA